MSSKPECSSASPCAESLRQHSIQRGRMSIKGIRLRIRQVQTREIVKVILWTVYMEEMWVAHRSERNSWFCRIICLTRTERPARFGTSETGLHNSAPRENNQTRERSDVFGWRFGWAIMTVNLTITPNRRTQRTAVSGSQRIRRPPPLIDAFSPRGSWACGGTKRPSC